MYMYANVIKNDRVILILKRKEREKKQTNKPAHDFIQMNQSCAS